MDEQMPITAYHGSPHQIGDEGFSNERIGTGTGVQAYGHGHYFNETEPVAQSYRDDLSSQKAMVEGQKSYGNESPAHEILSESNWDIDKAIENAHNHLHHFTHVERSASRINLLNEAIAQLNNWKNKSSVQKNTGHMYEVAIHAHPDHFLDWDKPLHEQSEHVKNAMSERSGLFEKGSLYTGKDLYRIFEDMHGDDSEKASNELRNKGIYGVKYFGDTSRSGLKKPTQNYVVFDPKDIEIKRRYAEGGYIHKGDGGEIDQPITAYHGTPHDFEQFDTSKIGTGEGAQAYGHGLYFAEHEPVAKEYRDRLTDRTSSFRVGNIDMPKWILRGIESAPDRNAAIEKHRQDFLKRLDEDTKDAETSSQPWMSAARISSHKDILAGLDQLQHGSDVPHTKGRMYEVHIDAHPDHFLDWNKTIGEQSNHVQKALNGKHSFSGDQPVGAALKRAYENELYGGDIAGKDRAKPYEVSEALSNLGIKGIRYLDFGSRDGTEKPTHNYVVFDHNRVSIKRKYEQGGRVAYQKGGKVEGAIWHEKDVYGNGGNIEEYRGEHQAPSRDDGVGVPLHNTTGVYPADLYGPNGLHYYGDKTDPIDQESYRHTVRLKGKPEAPVKIYRAVPHEPSSQEKLAKLESDMAAYQRRRTLPKDAGTTNGSQWYDNAYDLREKLRTQPIEPAPSTATINPGDWVTPSRAYAKLHGDSVLRGKYKILSKTVKAKDVFTNGDSLNEWGYDPEIPKAHGGAIPHGNPQRNANLAAFQEGNHPDVPHVLYHGTGGDFSVFNPQQRSDSVRSIFLSQTPEFANQFASEKNKNSSIMPVHVSLKNPFDYKNPDLVQKFLSDLVKDKDFMENFSGNEFNEFKKGLLEGHWHQVEDPWVQDAIKKRHDGFFAQGNGNRFLSVYKPEQIKSAIGNNGHFDPHDPDITKSSGGEVIPHGDPRRDENLARHMEGSKTPPVLYHGTNVWNEDGKQLGDIKTFNRHASVDTVGRKPSLDTLGNWFTSNPSEGGASMYAGSHGTVYPVHVSLKNPHVTSFDMMQRRARMLANGVDDNRRLGEKEVDAYRAWLKSNGKDGIRFTRDKSGELSNQDVWVALEPHQIKSAIGNNGNFDPSNPDITKAHGGSIAKTLQPVHNPAIVEHVLNKVGAALPALDPSLMAAKAGRRY